MDRRNFFSQLVAAAAGSIAAGSALAATRTALSPDGHRSHKSSCKGSGSCQGPNGEPPKPKPSKAKPPGKPGKQGPKVTPNRKKKIGKIKKPGLKPKP